MSNKRPAGLEGFILGDTPPPRPTSEIPDEGTSVDMEHEPEDGYHVVPRAAAGPVAETSFIEDSEGQPPSYEAAIRGYTEVSQDDEPPSAPPPAPPMAEAESDTLSPEEIAVVLKMQDQRRNYLPEASEKFDGEDEMEMEKPGSGPALNPENFGADGDDTDRDEIDTAEIRAGNVPRLAEQPSRERRASFGLHSVEAGETRDDRSDEECDGFGPLNIPLTRVRRFLKSLSGTRLVIAVIVLVALMGLIVFLGVFPASFVYVEYHELALKQSKMTGAFDRENVYYPGCYVLGPDAQFLKFPGTAQEIDMTMSVFTLDTISIEISFNLQYFLRPAELPKLHAEFAMDYEDVFRPIIISSVKNLAGTGITVDSFRFNRTHVEVQMHNMLRKKLGGDCCPACCPRNCQSNTFCTSCVWGGSCFQGYHIDVRFLSLKRVSIPNEVFEKYLLQTLLKIEQEKEFLLQERTLITKEIEKETKQTKNEAEEIIQQGYANSNKTKTVSEAKYEADVQYSYATAWKGLFSNLSVTQEDHKLSLMMMKALDDNVIQENLYLGYGYEKNTLSKN